MKGLKPLVAALTCWPEFSLQLVQVDLLSRCQSQFPRCALPDLIVDVLLGNRLTLAIRHGKLILKERVEVRELDLLLSDIAHAYDELDGFAVAVGPLLVGAEAQSRLQATDRLAPGGEALLFRLRLDFEF